MSGTICLGVVYNKAHSQMDMLMKLHPPVSLEESVETLSRQGILIRRAMAYERRFVIRWVEENFNAMWADECAAAFGHKPIGCYIAAKGDGICGFCCLNTTFQNFIGPIGVRQDCRRQGVGRGLLMSVAHALSFAGFAYGVIGDVGEPEFFNKAVGAWEIPDSTPGAYPRKI